jgi:hypothetical protein|tara:strand:- start:401 stop:991 length:591 start_codon:yes stop_codon:yes gene_type:complete
MSEIQANKISPATGTALQVGDSGDTITIPSGATITNSGTATGFGESNTPNFRAVRSANQTITNLTDTKIAYDSEDFDSDNAYDNSTNYRFTVPSGKAGKYYFHHAVLVNSFHGNTNANYYIQPKIKKNGSTVQQYQHYDYRSSGGKDMYADCSIILNMSVGDYVEAWIVDSDNNGSNNDVDDYLGFSCFEGFRISS